jgi:hypothetical protein
MRAVHLSKVSKILIVALLGSTMLTSCYKEEDTIAQVTVVLPNGNRVPGAEVLLYGEGTTEGEEVNNALAIRRTERTNGEGVARFDFSDQYEPGQSGFAILSVCVNKEYPDSIASAEGIINVIEEETSYKTFQLGENLPNCGQLEDEDGGG